MHCLAIIPARGGSKGIPNKNIAPVGGQPLIAWTIQAALSVSEIERIIVSTDAPNIAEIARDYGADVPFLRPAELAGDETSSMDVVIHLLDQLNTREGYCPEYILLLQPTSPLRNATDIRNAIQLANEKRASCVIGVSPVSQYPHWMKTISQNGVLLPFLELKTATRRQELPALYTPNGSIYLARREWILEQRSFYSDQTYAYIMPSERSIDIDEPWDLKLADLVLSNQNRS